MRSNEQRHLLLQMPFSGGDEGDRLAPRTARLGRSRSRQSTGLSLCTAPSSIPLVPFCKQQTKKRSTCFSASTSFCVSSPKSALFKVSSPKSTPTRTLKNLNLMAGSQFVLRQVFFYFLCQTKSDPVDFGKVTNKVYQIPTGFQLYIRPLGCNGRTETVLDAPACRRSLGL